MHRERPSTKCEKDFCFQLEIKVFAARIEEYDESFIDAVHEYNFQEFREFPDTMTYKSKKCVHFIHRKKVNGSWCPLQEAPRGIPSVKVINPRLI